MKNYVIIGNGVAATGCIEGIRSVDKDSKIRLFRLKIILFIAVLLYHIILRRKPHFRK